MGRSSSCLKIITCGSDSVDPDDLQSHPENKNSSDKRGWSFRKRSTRHRVLNNTVITETPSSVSKEIPQSAALDFHSTNDTSAPEKVVLSWPDEKAQLPTLVESSVPEIVFAEKSEDKVDVKVEEPNAISTQTTISENLAQRELLELNNVVKLQAAVRGHLVRCQAVGTLRCVQAIVKMQGLVRARYANKTSEIDASSKSTQKEYSKTTVQYVSIEKLLRNSFARQLLESTPRQKPINIKCDSSVQNSSWVWLERWMSASSSDSLDSPRPELNSGEIVSEKVDNFTPPIENEISEFADLKSNTKDKSVPIKTDEPLITYEVSQELEKHLMPSQPEKIYESNPPLENNLTDNHTTQLDAKSEFDAEQLKYFKDNFAHEQSKLAELSSTPISDSEPDLNINTVLHTEDNDIKTKEPGLTDSSVPHYTSFLPVGGSDCGTELSITSTLDSPDRSDTVIMEFDHEINVSKEEESPIRDETENVDIEITDTPAIPLPNSSDSTSIEPDKIEHTSSIIDVTKFGDVDSEKIEMESGQKGYRSSPETSPRTPHITTKPAESQTTPSITIPESQATPSSLVSTNSTKVKSDRSGSHPKRKILPLNKQSPSIPLHDSGTSDKKAARRRSSFGSVRPDNNIEQEQRPSNSGSASSSTLPSYMQATESARAKVSSRSSPTSSPDVPDVKKRHSLPSANGRQVSPLIQRSLSVAQPAVKGNSQPQERKWQR